jgi:hypothetical protein
VTLDGRALDDFAEVRGWLEETEPKHQSHKRAEPLQPPGVRNSAVSIFRSRGHQSGANIAADKIAEDRAKKDR